MASGRMIDNELGRTYREKRSHGMEENSRNLTGGVLKKGKFRGEYQQKFRFLVVFRVSGAFAYSSVAPSLSIRMYQLDSQWADFRSI
jgi:hypothetical protein